MLVITRGYTIYTTLVCLLTRSGSLQYDPFPFFESYPKFDTLPFSWHRFCGFCCLSCHVFAILCPTISTPICSLLLANMPQSQKVMHSKLPLATDVCPKTPTNTRSHERMPLANVTGYGACGHGPIGTKCTAGAVAGRPPPQGFKVHLCGRTWDTWGFVELSDKSSSRHGSDTFEQFGNLARFWTCFNVCLFFSPYFTSFRLWDPSHMICLEAVDNSCQGTSHVAVSSGRSPALHDESVYLQSGRGVQR